MILFEEETYAIRGAVFEVYREMGSGFLESVYQECLAEELGLRGIPFIAQPKLTLAYKGKTLQQSYQPDFICFNKIIVELKACSQLANEHKAQLINYIKARGFKLGMLVNFGHHPTVQIERYII